MSSKSKKAASTRSVASRAKAKPKAQARPDVLGNRRNGRRLQLGKRSDIQSLSLLKESTIKIYQECYKDIYRAGALDRKTKELVAIAASAIADCEGCLVGHLRKARALGATDDEIKEVIGVAFSVNAASVVDRADVAAAIAGFNINLDDE